MIRKISVAIGIFSCIFAQAQQPYLHPSTLGLHFFLNDFQSRQFLSTGTKMDAGLSLSYLHGLQPRLDYTIAVSGSFPTVIKRQTTGDHKSLLLQTDAQLRLRAFKTERAVQPFLSAGPGVYFFRNSGGAYFSSGAGLAFHYKDVYLEGMTQYRATVLPGMAGHFFYSIGIAGVISRPAVKKKKLPVAVAVLKPVSDRDGDGIVDSLDQCPDRAGLAIFQGCPDTDGDGIEDRQDACPRVPGISKYKGCPIPDRDHDGINDEEDQCPDTPGFIRYKGCPIPDTDKDGVNDEEDSCLLVPGIREKHGCPLAAPKLEAIAFAAQNIYFETNSAILLPNSFPALDTIAMILQQNPLVRLRIEGHTDNTGTPTNNLRLSKARALSVMNYLVGKGVNTRRLTVFGYGDTKPLTTNKTPEGKAKNRRVVFVILEN
jgi:outer membrane protein OmpA-like peptidoglycan-associated protein